jgi:hypothetical protein
LGIVETLLPNEVYFEIGFMRLSQLHDSLNLRRLTKELSGNNRSQAKAW